MANPFQQIAANLTAFDGEVLAHIPVLMEWLMAVVVEDNRVGHLRGENKDGEAYTEVSYRGQGKPIQAKGRTKNFGVQTIGHYLGPEILLEGVLIAKGAIANGNLSNAEYKKLTGPALAPRLERSRIIANLVVEWFTAGAEWIIRGAWKNVISKTGYEFLPAHFDGEGHLPTRDARGIRPRGMAWAQEKVDEWSAKVIQGAFAP